MARQASPNSYTIRLNLLVNQPMWKWIENTRETTSRSEFVRKALDAYKKQLESEGKKDEIS